jgi:hypothetical protein
MRSGHLLVVARGAKDARISENPRKCRHVVIPLQGLDLRMSTLFNVDMRSLKVFPELMLRMSQFLFSLVAIVIETMRPR